MTNYLENLTDYELEDLFNYLKIFPGAGEISIWTLKDNIRKEIKQRGKK